MVAYSVLLLMGEGKTFLFFWILKNMVNCKLFSLLDPSKHSLHPKFIFIFLSHHLSYTFPNGEREHQIKLAGSAWKSLGHPFQYEKLNRKNYRNMKNWRFNFAQQPPMIFAYLLSVFTILDRTKREKVVMQANLLKGTWVRQNYPNNHGPESSKNKNYTFKQNLSFTFSFLSIQTHQSKVRVSHQ